MAIPLIYNLRSLQARWTSAVVAVLGIAGSVGVFVAMLSLARGFQATLVASGSPGNAIVRRAGATSEIVRAGEKLGQERRESGGPWRSKNRPPEICLRKRSQEERFVGYRRDVHSGAICTRSARGLC